MNQEVKNLTEGNLLKKIILFTIPVMLTSLFQLLFNACDLMVVGKFSGESSLAAVGSTTALTSLIVNLFMGFSVGANVVVARSIGKKDRDKCQKVVHTAMLFSLIIGVAISIFGVISARSMLVALDTNKDILDKATLYLTICFAGSIFNMIYNFGASIVRATGETKKPLYYLTFSGIINVVLNLIFVLILNIDVAGVALATIISQFISAILIVRYLIKNEGDIHLDLKKLKISGESLKEMIIIGLPAGIQSSLFSISNVVIQTGINSFDSEIIVAANSASTSIGNFIYIAMNAFYHTSVTFTSQNMGAKNIENCKKSIIYCLSLVTITGILFGGTAILFGEQLLGLYTSDAEVVKQAFIRLTIIGSSYFLCGIGDVLVGGLRGLGSSLIPMINSVLGICGIRLLWIFTVFEANHTLEVLYYSYPLSWVVTAIIHFICYLIVYKRVKVKIQGC